MAQQMQVVLSTTFFTSVFKASKEIQKKVMDLLTKFRAAPESSALHLEPIASGLDGTIKSARIDQAYRLIVKWDDQEGVCIFLWVDAHDKAYKWALRKRCAVNPETGIVQLYDVQNVVEHVKVPDIFARATDGELLRLGVPQEQLPFVRSLTSKAAFYEAKTSFPGDVVEGLSWLLDEALSVQDVLDLMAEERAEQAGQTKPATLGEALGSAANQRFFHVVAGEQDLQDILAYPLEKWRVFLHPRQRAVVEKNYSGPARVTGGAGTGKTVVAMHRAKRLAAQLVAAGAREKVLFTTYTANLAADISENLKKICAPEELARIEAVNIDAWAREYMKTAGFDAEIVYEAKKLDSVWEEAVEEALDETLSFPASFYKEEWERVVVPQHAMTLVKYLRASRSGRGVSLNRAKRQKVFQVFDAYQRLMKAAGKRDVHWALDECRTLVAHAGKELYPHVIVDEGQDFSPVMMRLVRAIAGTEHANDIFIVGDAHQRIYRHKTVLKACGVNVRGRSSILRINYRTTEETRAFAMALLSGIPFDDLDGGTLTHDECQSLTHGAHPLVRNFADDAEEIAFLKKEIHALVEAGTSLKDICVTARTNDLVSTYLQALKGDFACFELKRTDDRARDGLRLATMHRVKGLEFQYVFVAGVNAGNVPARYIRGIKDPAAKEEELLSERCLLYVALTRAQRGAYVTSFGKPSPFLQPAASK